MEYHYLYVRNNSSNDHATSAINLVNLVGFWLVTPEFKLYNQRRSAIWYVHCVSKNDTDVAHYNFNAN